ncbi:MAG: leucyl aminopeptidase family protein [Phycisphaerales bacterium]|nr:leucyl aminopeptidase family protein [Planctomycetota bacterium]MCH8507964.1 leucyl aminopeptidase family protein [Phycisphaerales bacterium]
MFDSVKTVTRGSARVLVLAQFKGEKLDPDSRKLDDSGHGACAAERAEASGETGAIVEAFPDEGYDRVIVVGLGDKDAFRPGAVRNAAAAVGRALASAKAESVELAIHHAISRLPKSAKVDLHACASAAGEGLGLIAWNYDELRGSATSKKDRPKLSVHCDDAKFRAGIDRGLGLAEAANITRTLSQTPPNIATPAWMASEARKMARRAGLKCTVIQGKQLEDQKLVGMATVGRASENKPCMIRLEYSPARGKSKDPVVLVGKTITYDSGGLSLKVGGSMRGMKRDKDGGCAVFGAMHAIATVIKPNRPVVALLVCAENAVSDNAYRPDDVLTFRNGVTVEVTNTDAEGRLVLADGLCWACEKERPAAIIDMATLTGGVVVALGKVYAGMWCDDDDLRTKIDQAAEVSDELVWRLPHHAEYRAMMKSSVADIVNSAPVREAHPIQGAAFLSYFVEEGIPWAHIDIAGTHATEKDKGPYIAGPTGYGARLLAEVVERF